MTHNLQRNLSKIFHRRVPSTKKGGNEVLETAPKPHRTRPTFSLSSLSFRRPSVTAAQSDLTPPSTPPPSEADNGSVNRGPAPSHRVSERELEPISFLDFSPSQLSRLQQDVTLEHFHCHSAPPSPLSASFHHPPRPLERHQPVVSFPSESSSEISQVAPNEPRSAFSDWDSSIGVESRDPSSDDLLASEDGADEGGSVTGGSSCLEARRTTAVPEDARVSRDASFTTNESDGNRFERASSSSMSSSVSATAVEPSRRPDLNPASRRLSVRATNVQPVASPHRHRPHLLSHHHHSMHAKQPRESKVADSSYPELAIAFFLSLKKFKGRTLDRRASTGSLGGAV
ncbi:hypothetical protein JCM11491_004330 [Sporobolomyces phaffii]